MTVVCKVFVATEILNYGEYIVYATFGMKTAQSVMK